MHVFFERWWDQSCSAWCFEVGGRWSIFGFVDKCLESNVGKPVQGVQQWGGVREHGKVENDSFSYILDQLQRSNGAQRQIGQE